MTSSINDDVYVTNVLSQCHKKVKGHHVATALRCFNESTGDIIMQCYALLVSAHTTIAPPLMLTRRVPF